MSVMWKYLDKRSAAIAAIKDYDSMQFIISSTGEEVRNAYDYMTGGWRGSGIVMITHPRFCFRMRKAPGDLLPRGRSFTI